MLMYRPLYYYCINTLHEHCHIYKQILGKNGAGRNGIGKMAQVKMAEVIMVSVI